MRILMLDDEEENTRTLGRLLQFSLDSDFVAASTISEAQNSLARGEFDLMIVDLMLSDGESGLDFLYWLDSEDKPGKRMLITGLAECHVEHELNKLEKAPPKYDLLLFKPFSLPTVTNTILELMKS